MVEVNNIVEVKVTGSYKKEKYQAVLTFDIHELNTKAYYFILKAAISSCESCGLEFVGFEIL